jgi:hypothetical protein
MKFTVIFIIILLMASSNIVLYALEETSTNVISSSTVGSANPENDSDQIGQRCIFGCSRSAKICPTGQSWDRRLRKCQTVVDV